jgi:hypothetical protein
MAALLAALRGVIAYALGLAAAFAPLAVSAGSPTFREVLTGERADGRPIDPPVARYQTDEGAVFVLDRSSRHPLMKFIDDPEIWVLAPAPGPHGDVIYRNDLGEIMLRVTSMGGITVFTLHRPEGAAAALDGSSAPLHLLPMSPTALFRAFYQASGRSSRAAGRQIGFETREDAEPATAAPLADAALVASEALVDMGGTPKGKAMLARITDVVIAQGKKPDAGFQKGVLTVTIVPAEGVFGRPSSRKIERAAGVR